MKIRILALFIASTLASAAQTASAENLLQVFQRAKGYDAQFKAQESGHLATLEKKQQALAGFKPQVSLAGNANYNAAHDSISNVTVDGPAADYTVKVGKSLYNKTLNATLAQTEALVGQSTAALESYRQDLIMRVASAYFAALTAQDNLTFAGAEKNAIKHQLDQTSAYFEAGRSAITDVKEAESSYAAAVAQEITAQQQLDVAREQLRVLTGGFYSTLNTPRGNMPLVMPAPASIESWVSTAKQNNYLLRASKQGALVAQRGIAVERSARSPQVDLYATQTGSFVDNDVYNSKSTAGAAVGVSMSMPLYTGGAIASKVREAQHSFQQAQQQADYQERMTEQQVRSAYLSVQSSISQVKANQQALSSAETAQEATQAGFEVGTRTAVDVLNSLRSVFKARRDYASARYNYLQNTLVLRQAAGTLTEKDMVNISSFLTETPSVPVDAPADDAQSETTLTPAQDEAPTEQKAPKKASKAAAKKAAIQADADSAEPAAEVLADATAQAADTAVSAEGGYQYYAMPTPAK